MKTKSLTNTTANLTTSSTSSFNPKNTKSPILLNSDSYFSNSSDLSEAIRQNTIMNKYQHLTKERNDGFKDEQIKMNQSNEENDQSSILLEEMISSLQKKINYFQSKKNMLDSELKLTPKIYHNHQNEKNLFKTKCKNTFNDNNNEIANQYPENKAAKISKKVEKYIYAITNVDEEIHKCIQSIDSKTSFLNQSKTDFLKIQNIIDSVKFKIKKEKKHHEIILMKYRNEFKRLARERNEIEKLRFEKSILNARKYEKILSTKDDLSSELKLISAKKNRSNDRLKRMERQLKRLIQAESNIKEKLKKIVSRDKKESIISDLLNKLEQKLNEKQTKKDKQIHRDQVETQILLQTFDNLVQIIRREEDHEESEPIYLPDFPAKLIQHKNQKEANISKISDEINVVQNDIKLLNIEIRKTQKIKNKYQTQIFELENRKENRIQNNNYANVYHNENINIIYRNANSFVPNVHDDLDQLLTVLEQKRDNVNRKKRKFISRCEKYFLVLYEYGKNFQKW